MPHATVYIPSNTAIVVVGTGFAISQEEAMIKLDEKTGASPTYDFTNIPSGYRHLLIEISARGDTAATSTGVTLQFNGDTGSDYDYQRNTVAAGVTSPGETFAAGSIYLGNMPAASAAAGLFNAGRVDIQNYAGTSNNKGLTCFNANKTGTSSGSVFQEFCSGFWRNSAALTEIVLKPSSGSFAAGSIATLYALAS